MPKRIWLIPGARHLGCRVLEGEKYEREIADFFTSAFSKSNE
jgi:hypothetical protein